MQAIPELSKLLNDKDIEVSMPVATYIHQVRSIPSITDFHKTDFFSDNSNKTIETNTNLDQLSKKQDYLN